MKAAVYRNPIVFIPLELFHGLAVRVLSARRRGDGNVKIQPVPQRSRSLEFM
ncbi:MAG: hypothetical protein AAFY57_11695 [Cyanobacteria bacterium J06642_2]